MQDRQTNEGKKGKEQGQPTRNEQKIHMEMKQPKKKGKKRVRVGPWIVLSETTGAKIKTLGGETAFVCPAFFFEQKKNFCFALNSAWFSLDFQHSDLFVLLV
jgi:hypothetical protein